MMLSYLRTEGGAETLIVCLDGVDVMALITGRDITIPLSDLSRAADEDDVEHLDRVTLMILGPGSKDAVLYAAVEARDLGVDVRVEKVDYPGAPEADDGEA